MGVHSKNQLFIYLFIFIYFFAERGGGELHEIFFGARGDESPKKGAWIVCRFQRGFGKRRGYVFEVEGGLRRQCTL